MKQLTAVIILNFNNHQESIHCVQSVLSSSLKAHILLVDNFSTHSERANVTKKFSNMPRVYLLLPKENLGFAAGVNFALRHAVSEGYTNFLLLNNDAILVDGAGDYLSQAFQKNPGCLIAPTIVWDKKIFQGSYYHKLFGFICNKPLLTPHAYTYYLTGCALAFDKSVLARIGFFNESFFMYGEDVDFSIRAHKNKIPLILLQEQLVVHTGNHSSRKSSIFYEYHVTRSHFLLSLQIADSTLQKLASLLCKTIIMSLRAVYRTFKYRRLSPLLAFLAAPFQIKIRPKIHK